MMTGHLYQPTTIEQYTPLPPPRSNVLHNKPNPILLNGHSRAHICHEKPEHPTLSNVHLIRPPKCNPNTKQPTDHILKRVKNQSTSHQPTPHALHPPLSIPSSSPSPTTKPQSHPEPQPRQPPTRTRTRNRTRTKRCTPTLPTPLCPLFAPYYLLIPLPLQTPLLTAQRTDGTLQPRDRTTQSISVAVRIIRRDAGCEE